MRVLGALGIALLTVVLVGAGCESVGAIESENKNSVVMTVDMNEAMGWNRLTEAVERAREARELAAQNPSAKYPGLVKYIDKLLAEVETGEIADVDELISALDDAAFAVPLILGINKTEVTQRNVGEMLQEEDIVSEVARETGNVVLAETISVKVGAEKVSEVESAPEEETEPEVQVGAPELEVAELPKTGEVHKAGLGELMIAGVVVMMATVGATFAIVKNRK